MNVRIAVIGVGRMGRVHAKNLFGGRIPGASLAAVCDIDGAKRAEWEKRGVRAYASLEELLSREKPDGAVIAVPHPAHPALLIACLKAGVPALSEKPLSPDLKSAKEVVEISRATGTPFYMMYNQRTNPNYRKLKALLDRGGLGKIQRVNLTVTHWYRAQHYYDQGGWRASWQGEGGGILMNQCVHQLDILCWLLGTPATVYATARTINRKITVENDVNALFTYPEGYPCAFQASGHELKGVNRLEIAGDRGSVVVGKHKAVYTRFATSEPEVNARTTKGYGSVRARKQTWRYGVFRLLKEALRGGQQANVLDAFAKTIAGKGDPVAEGGEGLNALSLINAIYLSAARGKEVALPLNEEEYDAFFTRKKTEEANGQL